MAQTFRCTLITPERELLDAEITHASIPAWDGQIGLLYQRAPLLAKLGYGTLELQLADGSKQRFFIGGGFAQMRDDELSVLTHEATPAAEIDRKEAEAALKEAMARRGISEEEAGRKERDVNRARAMVALAQATG